MVPHDIANNVNFLNDWIQVNNHEHITINGVIYISKSHDSSDERTIITKSKLNNKFVLDGPTIHLVQRDNIYYLSSRQEYKCLQYH